VVPAHIPAGGTDLGDDVVCFQPEAVEQSLRREVEHHEIDQDAGTADDAEFDEFAGTVHHAQGGAAALLLRSWRRAGDIGRRVFSYIVLGHPSRLPSCGTVLSL